MPITTALAILALIVLILILIGFGLAYVNRLSIDLKIKWIINIFVVIVVIVGLLMITGAWKYLAGIRVG